MSWEIGGLRQHPQTNIGIPATNPMASAISCSNLCTIKGGRSSTINISMHPSTGCAPTAAEMKNSFMPESSFAKEPK